MLSKKYLITLAITLSLLTVVIIFYIFRPKIPGVKSEIKPKLVTQKKLTNQTQEAHLSLYYTDIEINLKSQQVTLLSRGRTKGDLPFLLPEPPATKSAELVYHLNVSSEKNVTVYQGYLRLPKSILAIKDNVFSIRVYSPDVPKTVIRLYDIGNRLLWSHKIQ